MRLRTSTARRGLALTIALLAGATDARAGGRIGLWLDGAEATRHKAALVAGLPSGSVVVTIRAVKRRAGSEAGRLAAAAAQSRAGAVLHARGKGRQLLLEYAAGGAEPATQRLTLPARASPSATRGTITAAVATLVRGAEAAAATNDAAATRSPPVGGARAAARPGGDTSTQHAAAPTATAPTAIAPTATAPTHGAASTRGTGPTRAAAPARAAAPGRAVAPPSSARAAAPGPASDDAGSAAPSTSSTFEGAELTRAAAPPAADALFSIALDGGVAARRLQYTQGVSNNLRPYSVGAVPWLGFRASLYPLQLTRVPFLRDLGIEADFAHSLYQQSVVGNGGPRVNGTFATVEGGLHERIHTGRHRFAPRVGLGVFYGRTAFTFDDGGQLISEMPSVDYRYVRIAADGHLQLGRVALYTDVAYRAVVSPGYVGSRFPHSRVDGLDVGAGLSIGLPRGFQIRVSGQYARFFYTMHAQPTDVYVAGGAVDEFASGELAVAWALQ